MSISKLHSKCEKCSYKDNCDNKRMVACGMLDPMQNSSQGASPQSLSMPIAIEHTSIEINMGEYGTINTSLEELHEQLRKEFWKSQCNFSK